MNLLERIYSRCIEDGDCLVWTGCGAKWDNPQIRVNKKTEQVRRILYEHENGKLRAGLKIAHTCNTKGCVKHIAAETHNKICKRVASTGVYSLPARCAKIAAARREASSKLTDEMVWDIRYGGGNAKEAGERNGISANHASQIRIGRLWKDYSNPFAALIG